MVSFISKEVELMGSLEIKRVVKKQREGNDYVGPWPLGEFHSFLDKDRYEGYY